MPSPVSAEIIKTRSNCLSADSSAARCRRSGFATRSILLRTAMAGRFTSGGRGGRGEEGGERLVEPAMGIDDKGHDIGVACPLPGGLRHGAVEPPLRLKDARRVDQDELGLADQRDA